MFGEFQLRHGGHSHGNGVIRLNILGVGRRLRAGSGTCTDHNGWCQVGHGNFSHSRRGQFAPDKYRHPGPRTHGRQRDDRRLHHRRHDAEEGAGDRAWAFDGGTRRARRAPQPDAQLYSGATPIASNDDWGHNTNAAEIQPPASGRGIARVRFCS